MQDFSSLYFKDSNIELKSATKEDLNELAGRVFSGNNFGEIARFTDISANQKDAQSYARHLYKYIESMKEKEKILLLIYYKGNLAGRIAAHKLDFKSQTAELGYFLFKEFRGLNIMSKSVELFEDFLFKELKLNRIELYIDTENTNSLSLANKMNYTYEGTLREDYFNSYLNELRSDQVWSKLKSDYKQEPF